MKDGWRKITAERGVICGTDQRQEWLLPWWWSRLKAVNDLPVVFCDFGMSEEAIAWCRERGEVVSIAMHPGAVASKEKVDPVLVAEWEGCHASYNIWDFREVWFTKPLALLSTPFQKTLWLDLDCEVLQSLDPIFAFCDAESQLGIMREFHRTHWPRFHPEAIYNSGVIVYEHGSSLIVQWVKAAMTQTDRFWGDEALLSHLINAEQILVQELPGVFNWRVSQGVNINAVICHWLGEGGKVFIRRFGGIKPSLDKTFL